MLDKELKRLQEIFQTGTELKVLHCPNDIRKGQNGRPLLGEVNGDFIIIYEADPEKATATLYHEFVEYIIMPLIQDYLSIINSQNQQITALLIKRKEEIVERLVTPLGNPKM